MGRCKPCKDHLGNEYGSINDMCRAYGITKEVLKGRLRTGASLADALAKPSERGPCKDHLGKEYPSRTAMCAAYDIPIAVLDFRLKQKYSLERALTEPVRPKFANEAARTDHTGKIYASEAKMCEAYGITNSVLHGRLDRGYTLERALTEPANADHIVKDHTGRTFRNAKALSEYWHVSRVTYNNRSFHAKRKRTPPEHVLPGVIAETYPGIAAGPYRITKCVAFPWFLAEDAAGNDVMLHADTIRKLLDQD